jgi:hypothetical protein
MAPGSPTRGGTTSRPTTTPATSASRSAPPGSATSPDLSASSAPATGYAPPSSAPPSSAPPSSAPPSHAPPSSAPPSHAPPSSAPPTEPAPSEPAGGGKLSLSRDCADQATVSKLDPYSCTLTASGGVPFYSWVLFVNGTIDYGYSLPGGLSAANGAPPYATFTIAGKPEVSGTYALTVQVTDQEPGNPPVTASTSFTLTVQ